MICPECGAEMVSQRRQIEHAGAFLDSIACHDCPFCHAHHRDIPSPENLQLHISFARRQLGPAAILFFAFFGLAGWRLRATR